MDLVVATPVTTAERFPAVHELPTFAECGVPGFDVASWYAFYLPARTPPEIIKKIQADTATALIDPAVRVKFEPLGTALIGSMPDQLADTARADAERFGPIIKALNITGE